MSQTLLQCVQGAFPSTVQTPTGCPCGSPDIFVRVRFDGDMRLLVRKVHRSRIEGALFCPDMKALSMKGYRFSATHKGWLTLRQQMMPFPGRFQLFQGPGVMSDEFCSSFHFPLGHRILCLSPSTCLKASSTRLATQQISLFMGSRA